jgi:hypothetical protein
MRIMLLRVTVARNFNLGPHHQFLLSAPLTITAHPAATTQMSMFRAKRLDLGCFVNVKVIRDHTKRKVFAEHEPERYASLPSTIHTGPEAIAL